MDGGSAAEALRASARGMLRIPRKSPCDFAEPQPHLQYKLTLNSDIFTAVLAENVDFVSLCSK